MDFTKLNGLIPAVIQDASNREVLMVGFMNEEALRLTREQGRVTFFSRSKNRLWTKGETSGHFLDVVEIKEDCDQDTVLIMARPHGPVCHQGTDTCFGAATAPNYQFLGTLEHVIKEAKLNPTEGSYTASLFAEGINKIAQKVGEEAVEVVIEAKDQNDHLFKDECADLTYHLLVLLREKGMSLKDIVQVLEARHSK